MTVTRATIEDVKQKSQQLRIEIARLVNEFEASTQCIVDDVRLSRVASISGEMDEVYVHIDVRLP